MLRTVLIVFLIFTLSACSDSNDEYIGYYSYVRPSVGEEMIAEIRKDGDVYLFFENTDRDALALDSTDVGLDYNGKSIRLSSDGDILYFAGITAERISETAVAERKENKRKAEEACNKLQAEVDARSDAIKDEQQWNDYVQQTRPTVPEGCRITGLGTRW